MTVGALRAAPRNPAEEIVGDPEEQIHSFVVRFWLEELEKESGRSVWRGSITHATRGHRQYLQDLDGIATFIAPYLQGLESQRGLWSRFRSLLAALLIRRR